MTSLSAELGHLGHLGPLGIWVALAVCILGFILRLTVILRAKQEDLPKIARVMFKRGWLRL